MTTLIGQKTLIRIYILRLVLLILLLSLFLESSLPINVSPERMLHSLTYASNVVIKLDKTSEVATLSTSKQVFHLLNKNKDSLVYQHLPTSSTALPTPPYGKTLRVAFEAFNERFDYDLALDTSVFDLNSRVKFNDSNGKTVFVTPRPSTYTTTFTEEDGSTGSAVFTVLDAGTAVDGVVYRNGEIYHIQPVYRHLSDPMYQSIDLASHASYYRPHTPSPATPHNVSTHVPQTIVSTPPTLVHDREHANATRTPTKPASALAESTSQTRLSPPPPMSSLSFSLLHASSLSTSAPASTSSSSWPASPTARPTPYVHSAHSALSPVTHLRRLQARSIAENGSGMVVYRLSDVLAHNDIQPIRGHTQGSRTDSPATSIHTDQRSLQSDTQSRLIDTQPPPIDTTSTSAKTATPTPTRPPTVAPTIPPASITSSALGSFPTHTSLSAPMPAAAVASIESVIPSASVSACLEVHAPTEDVSMYTVAQELVRLRRERMESREPERQKIKTYKENMGSSFSSFSPFSSSSSHFISSSSTPSSGSASLALKQPHTAVFPSLHSSSLHPLSTFSTFSFRNVSSFSPSMATAMSATQSPTHTLSRTQRLLNMRTNSHNTHIHTNDNPNGVTNDNTHAHTNTSPPTHTNNINKNTYLYAHAQAHSHTNTSSNNTFTRAHAHTSTRTPVHAHSYPYSHQDPYPPSPSSASHGSHQRRLLMPKLKKWTDCLYPNTGPYRARVAMVVDYGAHSSFGDSISKTILAVTAAMAQTNAVYSAQVDIVLTIKEILIKTSLDGTAWNHASRSNKYNTCPSRDAPEEHLRMFTQWRGDNYDASFAAVSLVTNCYPSPGVVGMAWVGTSCTSNYGTAFSNVGANWWVTNAHEHMHLFSALHTFQDGIGTTGGIMDYGDGRLRKDDPDNPGEYGFHTRYSKSQICTHLSNRVNMSCFYKYINKSECGNGVVEEGEECDVGKLGSKCCSADCKFIDTATCAVPLASSVASSISPLSSSFLSSSSLVFSSTSSSSSLPAPSPSSSIATAAPAPATAMSASSECCVDCQALSSVHTCHLVDGKRGICSAGQCVPSTCTSTYANVEFCAFSPENSCRQLCRVDNADACVDTYGGFSPIGTGCRKKDGKPGICIVNPEEGGDEVICGEEGYQWHISDDYKDCSCSGIREKYVTCRNSGGVIVSEFFCSHEPIPNTRETCSTPFSCANNQWKCISSTHIDGYELCNDSHFSSCNTSCGEGARERVVVCVSNNQVIHDENCPGHSKPPSIETCQSRDGCVYEWKCLPASKKENIDKGNNLNEGDADSSVVDDGDKNEGGVGADDEDVNDGLQRPGEEDVNTKQSSSSSSTSFSTPTSGSKDGITDVDLSIRIKATVCGEEHWEKCSGNCKTGANSGLVGYGVGRQRRSVVCMTQYYEIVEDSLCETNAEQKQSTVDKEASRDEEVEEKDGASAGGKPLQERECYSSELCSYSWKCSSIENPDFLADCDYGYGFTGCFGNCTHGIKRRNVYCTYSGEGNNSMRIQTSEKSIHAASNAQLGSQHDNSPVNPANIPLNDERHELPSGAHIIASILTDGRTIYSTQSQDTLTDTGTGSPDSTSNYGDNFGIPNVNSGSSDDSFDIRPKSTDVTSLTDVKSHILSLSPASSSSSLPTLYPSHFSYSVAKTTLFSTRSIDISIQPPDKCPDLARPSVTTPCTREHACVATLSYAWYCHIPTQHPSTAVICDISSKYALWSMCSSACGTGIRQRTVHCRDSTGKIVPEALCAQFAGERPIESKECHSIASCTFTWLCYSEYKDGIYKDLGACEDNIQGSDYKDNVDNDEIGIDRDTTRNTSSALSSSGSLRSSFSSLSSFSALTSTSTSTTPLSMGRSPVLPAAPAPSAPLSALLASSLSSAASPLVPLTSPWPSYSSSVASHASSTPSLVYSPSSRWSPCSNTCGKGFQTRQVACFTSSLHPVNDKHCNSVQKPIRLKSCVATHTCGWVVDKWTACTCDKQTKTRHVYCIDTHSKERDASGTNSINTGSSGYISAFLNPKYQNLEISRHSTRIGQSLGQNVSGIVQKGNTDQYRDSYYYKVVDTEICEMMSEKPEETGMCSDITCDGAGTSADDGIAPNGGTPTTPTSVGLPMCEGTNCHKGEEEGSKPIFQWKYGEWQECNSECGKGYRIRDATCMFYESQHFFKEGGVGRGVDEEYCSESVPEIAQECIEGEADVCGEYIQGSYCGVYTFLHHFQLLPIHVCKCKYGIDTTNSKRCTHLPTINDDIAYISTNRNTRSSTSKNSSIATEVNNDAGVDPALNGEVTSDVGNSTSTTINPETNRSMNTRLDTSRSTSTGTGIGMGKSTGVLSFSLASALPSSFYVFVGSHEHMQSLRNTVGIVTGDTRTTGSHITATTIDTCTTNIITRTRTNTNIDTNALIKTHGDSDDGKTWDKNDFIAIRNHPVLVHTLRKGDVNASFLIPEYLALGKSGIFLIEKSSYDDASEAVWAGNEGDVILGMIAKEYDFPNINSDSMSSTDLCYGNGQFRPELSSCICFPGYFGKFCENSQCDKCNSYGSVCIPSEGICHCRHGYTGTTCHKSTLCTSHEINSLMCGYGHAAPTQLSRSCSSCFCMNMWTGDACDECNLCYEDRYISHENCTKCICKKGFGGEDCSCRAVYLQFTFTIPQFNLSGVSFPDFKEDNMARQRDLKEITPREVDTSSEDGNNGVISDASLMYLDSPIIMRKAAFKRLMLQQFIYNIEEEVIAELADALDIDRSRVRVTEVKRLDPGKTYNITNTGNPRITTEIPEDYINVNTYTVKISLLGHCSPPLLKPSQPPNDIDNDAAIQAEILRGDIGIIKANVPKNHKPDPILRIPAPEMNSSEFTGNLDFLNASSSTITTSLDGEKETILTQRQDKDEETAVPSLSGAKSGISEADISVLDLYIKLPQLIRKLDFFIGKPTKNSEYLNTTTTATRSSSSHFPVRRDIGPVPSSTRIGRTEIYAASSSLRPNAPYMVQNVPFGGVLAGIDMGSIVYYDELCTSGDDLCPYYGTDRSGKNKSPNDDFPMWAIITCAAGGGLLLIICTIVAYKKKLCCNKSKLVSRPGGQAQPPEPAPLQASVPTSAAAGIPIATMQDTAAVGIGTNRIATTGTNSIITGAGIGDVRTNTYPSATTAADIGAGVNNIDPHLNMYTDTNASTDMDADTSPVNHDRSGDITFIDTLSQPVVMPMQSMMSSRPFPAPLSEQPPPPPSRQPPPALQPLAVPQPQQPPSIPPTLPALSTVQSPLRQVQPTLSPALPPQSPVLLPSVASPLSVVARSSVGAGTSTDMGMRAGSDLIVAGESSGTRIGTDVSTTATMWMSASNVSRLQTSLHSISLNGENEDIGPSMED